MRSGNLGVILAGVLVAAAILVHAAVPRYELRPLEGAAFARVDHWTGIVELSTLNGPGRAAWLTIAHVAADPAAATTNTTAELAGISIVLVMGLAVLGWRFSRAWQAEQRWKAEHAHTP